MFHSIRDTLNRYFEVSRWLFHDLASVFWRQFVIIMVARLLGIGCFILALGVMTFYARRLEADQSIDVLGYTFEPRESVQLLIVIGCAVLVAMLAGAGLTYLSIRRALLLRRDYMMFCCQRVLQLASEAVRLGLPPEIDEPPERFLQTLAKRDSRYCGRVAALIITSAIPAAVVLLIAIPTLLYINFWLSLIVAVIVSLSVVQHYRLSVQTARLSLDRETLVTQVSQLYRRKIIESAQQHAPRSARELQNPFSGEDVQNYLSAEIGFRIASHRSQFINDIAIGVAVMTILIVLGSTILIQGTGWSTLLVYLIAMRYSMSQLRALMAAVTNSNRFYHQIRRYFVFVENTRSVESIAKTSPPEKLTVQITGEPPIEESQESMPISIGDRCALLTPLPLNRYVLPQMMGALLHHKGKEGAIEHLLPHTALITRNTQLAPAESMRDALGLHGDKGLERLQPMLAACGFWERVRGLLPEDAEPPLDLPVPSILEDDLRITLLLLAATRRFRILIVERGALDAIESELRLRVLAQLKGSIVWIVGRDIESVGAYDELGVAVLNESGVVGLGSPGWFEQHRDTIAEIISEYMEPAGMAAGGAADDDDDY